MFDEPNKKVKVVQKAQVQYTNTTKIQSIFSAHLKYQGANSGKLYEWMNSGDIVSVNNEDVSDLLEKRIGQKGCCGGNADGNRVFVILEQMEE